MKNWIRRLLSPLVTPPLTPAVVPALPAPAPAPRASAPPITELDLLRAFGCDV